MKKPRITDFDPDAKIPTLKSSLDNMPAIQKPKATYQTPAFKSVSSPIPEQNEEEPITKSLAPEQKVAKSSKRSLVRRTFDLYEDQISYLTRESLQERLAGNDVSMNGMIREAIDNWIKKRTSGK